MARHGHCPFSFGGGVACGVGRGGPIQGCRCGRDAGLSLSPSCDAGSAQYGALSEHGQDRPDGQQRGVFSGALLARRVADVAAAGGSALPAAHAWTSPHAAYSGMANTLSTTRF